MKHTGMTAAALAAALMMGTFAWAQSDKATKAGHKGPGMMQQADANKDGKVTFEELKAVRPKMTPERFKQLDTNSDGALDKADRPQGRPGGGLLALIKEADANKDDKATLDEVKAVRPKMTEERFKAMDHDKDGALTKADMPKDAPATAGKPDHKPGGKMKEADVNNDGKVSFDELKAVRPNLTQEEFKKLDKDGDGAITKADRKKES